MTIDHNMTDEEFRDFQQKLRDEILARKDEFRFVDKIKPNPLFGQYVMKISLSQTDKSPVEFEKVFHDNFEDILA